MIPLVAGLLKGGLSLLANAALSKGKEYIKEKTGITLSEDGQIPEGDLLQLRQYEMDHKEELQRLQLEDDKLSLEVTKAYFQTVDSARDMQKTALTQDDKFSKRFLYYYATAWSFASMVYIGFITFGTIPEANIRFADTILGFLLGTIVAQIIQFFFGSSKSSQNKDTVLQEAVKITRK